MKGAAARHRAHGVASRAEESACVICGCSDLAACPDGCSWIIVDRATRRGICSTDRCMQLALRRLTRPRRRR